MNNLIIITSTICLSLIVSCSSDLPLDEKFESKAEKAKKETEKAKKENEISLNKGNLFLENNKKNTQVQVTASGLQYEVLREGLGPKPGRAVRTVPQMTCAKQSGKRQEKMLRTRHLAQCVGHM